MTPQPEQTNGDYYPEPDVFDLIAELLQPEARPGYYRLMAHLKVLPQSDEMLRILLAMGFLTLLIKQAPGEVASERKKIAEILTASVKAIEATHQENVAWQKQLEARIAKLPEEIVKGINAEAIAAKLSESLRQQFQKTGLPAVANEIREQTTTLRGASKDLSAVLDKLMDSSGGAVARINNLLRWAKADLQNAGEHIRAQMNEIGKELNRSIVVFCLASVVVGLFGGSLYQRWMDAPPPKPAEAVAPAAESAPPPEPRAVPQPNHKKRVAQQ